MRLLKRQPDLGYLDSSLWIPKTQVNVEGVKRALTFDLSTERAVNILSLYKETEHHLLVPREFWKTEELSKDFKIVDCRPKSYPRVEIEDGIKLDHRPVGGVLKSTGETIQQEAFDALMGARGGILQLACGIGKTILALKAIATWRVPALILVDNTQLLLQWRGEIEKHLMVPAGVGLIQAAVFDWQKPIVLATYQTMANRAESLPEEVRRWFGVTVSDELHHHAAPYFSRSIDLFYGKRLGLTATPNRDDGFHIVYNFHIGPVIHKNLKPELKARIYFRWTGFDLDLSQPGVSQQVMDKNGELHTRKLAGYFGQYRPRLDFILALVREAREEGRRLLVISESVSECVNLLALWTGQTKLYTDIPIPTPADVGETLEPAYLAESAVNRLERIRTQTNTQLAIATLNPLKREKLFEKKVALELQLQQQEVGKKILAELAKRRTQYLRALLANDSEAGLLIQNVKATTRLAFVKTKPILFSIAKYGREGLDNPELDTVLVCEPFSSRNILQQLLGRPSRRLGPDRVGVKKTPVVVILEDEIGPLVGMCQKLRKHIRDWPDDEGGPLDFELVGHPKIKRSFK